VARALCPPAEIRTSALDRVPRASQLQLAQPLLTLVRSFLALGEEVTAAAPVAAVAVLVCIAVTQRAWSRGARRKGADTPVQT
jgi:drug/metabolite transporter (DMT)-like permease